MLPKDKIALIREFLKKLEEKGGSLTYDNYSSRELAEIELSLDEILDTLVFLDGKID